MLRIDNQAQASTETGQAQQPQSPAIEAQENATQGGYLVFLLSIRRKPFLLLILCRR